ncbi:hypothetical protein CQY21_02405 [Mycolicibacterium boenickei]|nr:hypothetical protein CQY21_02405 [Mycolicibacterium boenickei]
MRLAKMLSIYKPSLVKRTLKAPQVHGLYSAANRLLNDWQSTTSLPSATPPFGSITDAVAVLLSSFAERKVSEGSYRRLCGFAHASPRDITELYELTWRESAQMNAVRYAEAVGDIAVGLRSVCAATLRVYRLRVPPSELDHKLLGIRIQHFGLVIDEITARLGAFWKTVPQLMEQAYASRGMESPRLEDLFDDMSDDGEDETD